MSNDASTKLFFDEELNSVLLEGGYNYGYIGEPKKLKWVHAKYSLDKTGMALISRMPAPVMPNKDRTGFIRKTFGLFAVMILIQAIYINSINKDTTGNFKKFALHKNTMWSGFWMTIIPVVYMLYKKSYYKPVHAVISSLCWLVYTAGLTLWGGSFAAMCESKTLTTILVVQISTMITCLGCICLGARLVPYRGSHPTCL